MANNTITALNPQAASLRWQVQSTAPGRVTWASSNPGFRPPFIKARVKARQALTHDDIVEHRTEKLNQQTRREAEQRKLKLSKRAQARIRASERFEQRQSKRLQALVESTKALSDQKRSQASSQAGATNTEPAHEAAIESHANAASSLPSLHEIDKRAMQAPLANQDCNDLLRSVANRYQLTFEIIGESNETKACADKRPILVAGKSAVQILKETDPYNQAAIVHPEFDNCRQTFYPNLNCHSRSPIGLTSVGDLIAELDPVLGAWNWTYVFMSYDESELWLAEMRKRSPQDSHLPVIRLASKNRVVESILDNVAIAAVSLAPVAMILIWNQKAIAKEIGKCKDGREIPKCLDRREEGRVDVEVALNEMGNSQPEDDQQAQPVQQIPSILEASQEDRDDAESGREHDE